MDAGHFTRSVGVNSPDSGMSVGAPDEGCVQHPRQLNVVDKTALPSQQGRILEARNPRAKVLCTHAF